MRKILKLFGVLILSLMIIVVAALMALVARPQLIVNSKNLTCAQEFLKSHQLDITWGKGAVEVKSHSLTKKEMHLSLERLCFDLKSPLLKGCLDQFKIGAVIDIGRPTQILEVAPVIVHGKGFTLQFSDEKKQPSPSSGWDKWVSFKKMSLHGLDVQIQDFKISQGEALYQTALALKDAPQTGASWDIRLQAMLQETKSRLKMQTDLKLAGEKNSFNLPLRAQGPLHIVAGKGMELDADLDFRIEDFRNIQYQVGLLLRQAKNQFKGHIDGKLDADALHIGITGGASLQGFNLAIGEHRPCSIDAGLDGHYKMNCPIQFQSAMAPIRQYIRVLYGLQLNLLGDLHSAFPPAPANDWRGTVTLDIPRYRQTYADLGGTVSAELKKAPLDSHLLEQVMFKGGLDIAVLDFRQLVTRLNRSAFIPPAPLNPMRGKIQVRANGTLIPGQTALPITLQTRLASDQQSLNIDAQGDFGFDQLDGKMNPDLNLDVVLSDVQLVLPKLALEKPPAIIPDARLKGPVNQKPPYFLYRITVKTPEGKPLRLISNLAKAPIPISLDADLASGDPTRARISVGGFPLELFRRDASVSFLNLTLQGELDTPISGEANINYTDYQIKIILDGTAEKPRVKFESDPPLAENQVVAVLLFGHPTDDLDPDQINSVGNTQSALADGALSLGSLFLLASTPIESVGYNSDKKIYTAKVRLQQGYSVNIGSDAEGVREFGVNKRLGRSWSIHTYLNNPMETQDRSVTAFLEWFKKY